MGKISFFLLETALPCLQGKKDQLLPMVPSNDRNHHFFSFSFLILFHCVATVGLRGSSDSEVAMEPCLPLR